MLGSSLYIYRLFEDLLGGLIREDTDDPKSSWNLQVQTADS